MTSSGGSSKAGMKDCVFCSLPPERILWESNHVIVIRDAFPVSEGHTLVIPKRHVRTYFDATEAEQAAIWRAVERAREDLNATLDPRPDGFNVGFNAGEAAGQTVGHAHIHVIPRFEGDVDDPAGGVRGVIPGKQKYRSDDDGSATAQYAATTAYTPTPGSVLGGDGSPVLDRLLEDLQDAKNIDIAVAFVSQSGLNLVQSHLEDLLARGGRVRAITGDYLEFTEPRALLSLLDLQTPEHDDRLELKVFQSKPALGFHPKAYLMPGRAVYVGSSNMTAPGLLRGIEWNLRVDPRQHPEGANALQAEFEALFTHDQATPLTPEWIRAYRERYDRRQRIRPTTAGLDAEDEPTEPPPEPRPLQRQALEALARTRLAGNRAGLVVMATGLGKTWLSAFDVEAFAQERGLVGKDRGMLRVLFVAHRKEILDQARATYRRLLPDAVLGLYTGQEKAPEADVVFASVLSLGKRSHLERFSPRHFDYIVVDEFHHAAASTYRRLIEYFEPAFLLGLTATPERMDGGDLLSLCEENLVHRCDLIEGIREEELSPFHYFGVPDEVPYDQIKWQNGRFDPQQLEQHVLTRSRAQNAFEQWEKRGGARTLGFCVSQRHADEMAGFFRDRGVSAVAVHSGPTTAHRAESIKRFRAGELQVLFAVDIFNEGVDLPSIDTVLMLRPTESRVIWLQQLGRGLRKSAEKSHLVVVDYIGNHRTFLQAVSALIPGLDDNPAALKRALVAYREGSLKDLLPPGCKIEYELEAIDILEGLITIPKTSRAVEQFYDLFKERYDRRPTASEVWHSGYDPKKVRSSHGSWFEFVAHKGDLSKPQQRALDPGKEFLRQLESTQMTKSYKMVMLLAMVARGKFPGEIGIDELTEAYALRVRRSARLRTELTVDPEVLPLVRDSLERNPINAWTEGKGTGGRAYFAYENGRFRSTLAVPDEAQEPLAELAEELAQWRVSQKLEDLAGQEGLAPRIRCKVSHAGQKPILFYAPGRDEVSGIPTDWIPVIVSGAEGPKRYEFKFVKVAINVARRIGEQTNVLPELLRGLFGADAGASGTNDHLLLELTGDTYEAIPLPSPDATKPLPSKTAERWQPYMRAEIAPAFGLTYEEAKWRQRGIILDEDRKYLFLLVTLDKEGFSKEHLYGDRFLSAERFEWQSQNQNPQKGKIGQIIRHHAERGWTVHLFARRRGKTGRGKAAPFIYCGALTFVDWEGEKPITVRWELEDPVPKELRGELGL